MASVTSVLRSTVYWILSSQFYCDLSSDYLSHSLFLLGSLIGFVRLLACKANILITMGWILMKLDENVGT